MEVVMTGSRHFSSICLALALITQFAPAKAAQSAWYRLTGSDRDFAVEFPSRPRYEVVPVPSTGERLHTYSIAYGNNHLSFNYIDLRLPSAAGKTPVKTHLGIYARDYTRWIINAGGQVLMRTLLPDGGTEFLSRYPAGKAREISYEQSRVYFRGTRRYVLSCTSLSTSGIDQTVARRFFSSFRLYGTQRLGRASKDGSRVDTTLPTQNRAHTAWYKFMPPSGDFEAEFPDRPDYNTKAHPVVGTQIESVSFTYGEYDLSVQSSVLVPQPATLAEQEQWFADAAERFVKGSQSSLIQQARLADGALQFESRRQLDGRTMFSRVRVYIRGSRGYIVSCSVFSQSLSALDEPLPARFFASFRLR